MVDLTFLTFSQSFPGLTGFQYNPYSVSNFDPLAVLAQGGRTLVRDTATEYTFDVATNVPGLGVVAVRVTFRPPSGGALTTGGGGPLGSVEMFAMTGGSFQIFLGIDVPNLTASQLTGTILTDGITTISGSQGNDLINGGPGNDFLLGAPGNDVVLGGAGSDTLQGNAGDDVLSGDGVTSLAFDTPAGADLLNGGAGADSLYGGGGTDTYQYFSAAETLFGYDAGTGKYLGDTIVDFEQGLDLIDLRGFSGAIVLSKFGANTFVYIDTDGDGVAESGEGQIVVYNSAVGGIDLLIDNRGVTSYGSSVGDFLRGSDRADVIAGYAGGDVIVGGGGGDILYAGAADGVRDIIRYGAASDSPYASADATGANVDKVYDFEVGIDKLDFSFIAGAKTASIQSFGGSTYVYVDLGQDGSYDMEVIVVGVTGLTQGDLILHYAFAPIAPVASPSLAVETQAGPEPSWDMAEPVFAPPEPHGGGFAHWSLV